MSEKLSSCPQCGGSDFGLMRIQEVQGLEWYQVSCKVCGTLAEWKNTPEEAIASWNRRLEHE